MISEALNGVSKRERETMLNLLRMSPAQQKDVAAPQTTKGEAQRRRREREREEAKIPTVGG